MKKRRIPLIDHLKVPGCVSNVHGIIVFFFRSFLIVIAIAAVSYALLAYSLTSQTFKARAASEIDDLLTQMGIGGTPVDVGKSSWGGFFHPLSLTLSDMRLIPSQDSEDDLLHKFNYEMHHLKIGIRFLDLIQGKIKIKSLSVENLRFFPVNTNQSMDQPLGELTFHLDYADPDFECSIEKCHFNPKDLMRIHYVIPSFLKDVDIPLNLQGRVIYKNGNLVDGNLILTTDKGQVKCPPFYPQNLMIEDLTAHVVVKDNLFIVEDLGFSHGVGDGLDNVQVSFKGMAGLEDKTQNLWGQGGGIQLSLQGEAQSIPVDNLSTLWPLGLAPNARDWVIKNITVGVATRATINLTGRYILAAEGEKDRFHLTHLSGDIDADNITVQYLDKLPFVTGASGACHYTQDNFTIQASGHVNGLVLESGHINISDFDKGDETIDIRLELVGPVERALNIIAQEPLAFPQKLGFNPTIFQGSSHTFLHLTFPLVKNLALEKVMVKTQSKIFDGKIGHLEGGAGIKNPMEQGRFDLYVDNHHLELDGSALCLTIPTEIHWIERFHPDKTENQSEWNLSGPLSFAPLLENSERISESENEGFSLEYLVKQDKSGRLSAKADLRNLEFQFPYFSIDHKRGTPLLLTFNSHFDNKNLHLIQAAHLEGEGISISAQGALNLGDSKGNLKKIESFENLPFENLDFNVVEFGDLSGVLKVSGSYSNPRLGGKIKTLDVEKFLNDELISDSEMKLNGVIDVLVGRMKMSKELSFEDVSCRLDWQDDFLHSAHIHAKDPEKLDLILTPAKPSPKGKSQLFSLRSNNAGDLLDCFLPKNDLKGGVINVVGNRTHINNETILDGEIDVRDVVVKEAPFLAQLLSATSFQGIHDTLTGSGIRFDSCRGRFTWADKDILLQGLHLGGGSIGLDIEGTISLESDELDLVGEIYPLHGLNHFMAKIPLLGGALSGGTSKGIFSTAFEAKGHKDHPKIIVNPLTTFAPGAVRKVMKEVTQPREQDLELASPSE